MIKLLFARVLPLGLTGMFLRSSVSPLKPALQAFAAANAALSGEAVQNSGADFSEVIDAAQQVGKEATNPGKVAQAKPKKVNAKDQLNDIINQVKGQSGQSSSPQTETAQAPQHPKKGGKGGKSGAAPTPNPDPSGTPGQAPESAPTGPEVKLTSVKGRK